MRLAVPDLISNSYFPAIAAVELGLMREEGLDVSLDLVFPVTTAAKALRDGDIDFLAGAAHAPLYANTSWGETKLVAALSQNMYWFLVVRADSTWGRGEISQLTNLRIGAAPGPDLGLQQLLIQAGVDLAGSNVQIAPVPGTDNASVSFGVTAADALSAGSIDAFWANGMGAEVAVRRGDGKVIFDARRDGGDSASFTFPALMVTGRLVQERPDAVAAAVRAVVRAQRILGGDPSRATEIGCRLFPAMEAGLIAELVRRDVPFYQPAIAESTIAGVNDFARKAGLLAGDAAFEDVVATEFSQLWRE